MKTNLEMLGHNGGIIFDRPIVGITSPEFQEFAKEVIAAIGRSTRRLIKGFGALLVRAGRAIKKSLNESAEMHNRATANLDERYSRNWYYIRSAL